MLCRSALYQVVAQHCLLWVELHLKSYINPKFKGSHQHMCYPILNKCCFQGHLHIEHVSVVEPVCE